MNENITEDGEIIPPNGRGDYESDPRDRALTLPGETTGSVVGSLARAEIDMQIVTAKRYPRPRASLIATSITELATMDEETAEECCYALVRGAAKRAAKGKSKAELIKASSEEKKENRAIEGPSIRLAEIAATCWGNNRNGYRPVEINREDKVVTAMGVFHDLQTNVTTTTVVTRPIRASGGAIYSDDMIAQTMNAAGQIARRNAILAGIPKGVTRPGYQAARKVIVGTVQTLVANRQKMFKAWAAYAITPAQLLAKLGLEDESEIGLDQIALLRGMFSSIKNGENTPERMFAHDADEPHHHDVVDPLATTASGDDEDQDRRDEPEQRQAKATRTRRQPDETAESATTASPTSAAPADGASTTQSAQQIESIAQDAGSTAVQDRSPSDVTTQSNVVPMKKDDQAQSESGTRSDTPKNLTEYMAKWRSILSEELGEGPEASAALWTRWVNKAEKDLRIKIGITSEAFRELDDGVRAACRKMDEAFKR